MIGCPGSNADRAPDDGPRLETDDTGRSSSKLPGVCEHVQCLVDVLPENLAAEQRQQAVDFLVSHRDQFSKSEYELGRTRMVQHQIDTDNNHPITYLPVIDYHVQRMHDADVIVPATSPWASNVTKVTKEDGSLRFCVDCRRLNDMTGKDSYPLPRIEDCCHSLGQAQFVSTLDLKAGYWQADILQLDRDNTCSVTRMVTWRFKVLSFDFTNAHALF